MRRFLIAAGTAFGISCLYNVIVDRLERAGRMEGIKALLVIIGATYTTLAMGAFLRREQVLKVLGTFLIALIPMLWGDINRSIEYRQEAEWRWRDKQ